MPSEQIHDRRRRSIDQERWWQPSLQSLTGTIRIGERLSPLREVTREVDNPTVHRRSERAIGLKHHILVWDHDGSRCQVNIDWLLRGEML